MLDAGPVIDMCSNQGNFAELRHLLEIENPELARRLRIKTNLRTSMGDERLSSLAIIAVERELSEALMENPDKVIDEFARPNRRIDLIV